MSDFFDEKETEIIRATQNAMVDGYMNLKDYYMDIIKGLQEKIDELQQFSNVSTVKQLITANAELKEEINVLKRRYQKISSERPTASEKSQVPLPEFKQQSPQPAPQPGPQPTPQPAPQPEHEHKAKPTIKPKKKETQAQAAQVPARQLTPPPSPAPAPVRQPSPAPAPVRQPSPLLRDPSPVMESELDTGLTPIQIESGFYYLDPTDGSLFDVLADTTPGEKVGALKMVSIRGNVYYLDVADDNIYARLPDGNVGDRCGKRTNGKAVLNKK